jgi:AraC-like DNA-binding protein
VDWAPGYREFSPPKRLRDTLTCLWVGITSPARAERTLVLPDACADLIWAQGDAAFLAGPDTGPAPVIQPPGAVIVGARFRPGAGGTVLGLPLAEIANRRIAVDQIPAVRGRMPPPDLPPGQALTALTGLVASLASDRPADAVVTGAVRQLACPGTRAEDVARTLDLSERQFRRRCQAAVGYGPGTLQRIIRFRRFVSAIDAGAASAGGSAGGGAREGGGLTGGLADAAVAAGYSDQPHLTRECVRLSGLTPAVLARTRVS